MGRYLAGPWSDPIGSSYRSTDGGHELVGVIHSHDSDPLWIGRCHSLGHLFFDYTFADAPSCFEDFIEVGVPAGVSLAPVGFLLDLVDDGWYIIKDFGAFFGGDALTPHLLVDRSAEGWISDVFIIVDFSEGCADAVMMG